MLLETAQAAVQPQVATISFTLGQILAWGFSLLALVFSLFGGFLVWYAKKAVEKLSSIDNELKDYKKHVELTYKQKSECTRDCGTTDLAKAIKEVIHKEAKSITKLFSDLFKDHKIERRAKA